CLQRQRRRLPTARAAVSHVAEPGSRPQPILADPVRPDVSPDADRRAIMDAMTSPVVHRVDFGYFVRPAEETGTGASRVEPCLGYLVDHPDGLLLVDTGM